MCKPCRVALRRRYKEIHRQYRCKMDLRMNAPLGTEWRFHSREFYPHHKHWGVCLGQKVIPMCFSIKYTGDACATVRHYTHYPLSHFFRCCIWIAQLLANATKHFISEMFSCQLGNFPANLPSYWTSCHANKLRGRNKLPKSEYQLSVTMLLIITRWLYKVHQCANVGFSSAVYIMHQTIPNPYKLYLLS